MKIKYWHLTLLTIVCLSFDNPWVGLPVGAVWMVVTIRVFARWIGSRGERAAQNAQRLTEYRAQIQRVEDSFKPDPFGAMPVRNLSERIAHSAAVRMLLAQHGDDADWDDDSGDPISYAGGRYPELPVERMMINGVDVPLDDRQREEIAVWGTVDGVPIEDFDDWADRP